MFTATRMERSFEALNVDKLRQYLQVCGIPSSNYRRETLLTLCQSASDLQVPPIPDDDHTVSLCKRRRVGDWEAPELNLVTWTDDLRGIPDLHMGNVVLYLTTVITKLRHS